MASKGQRQIEWTDERRATLRKLWSRRPLLSDSQIAEIMGHGFTRHMVNSQAHRLGLPSRRAERSRQWQAARKVKRAQRADYDYREKGKPKKPTQKYLKSPVWGALPESVPVPIEAVDGCRWPIGDKHPFTFCNLPIDQGHYCKAHYRVAYGGIDGIDEDGMPVLRRIDEFAAFAGGVGVCPDVEAA